MINDSDRRVLNVIYNNGTTSGYRIKKDAGVQNIKESLNRLLQYPYITTAGRKFGFLTEQEALDSYSCCLPSHLWEIQYELKKLFRQ